MNEQLKILNPAYFYLFILLMLSCEKPNTPQKIDKELATLSDSVYNIIYKSSLPNYQKLEVVEKFKTSVFKNPNDSLTRKSLLRISGFYYYLNEFEKSTQTTKKNILLAQKARDSLHIINNYNQLSKYYSLGGKTDSAYYYLNEAEKLAFSIDNKKWQSKTLYSKAIILSHAKSYIKAENLTVEAYKIAEAINDELLKYECLNFLGMLLTYNLDFKKSEDYHKRALAQIPKITHLPHYHAILSAQTCKNLGLNKIAAKNYSTAKMHFEQGLSIPNIKNLHPGLYADLLDYHSFCLLKLDKLHDPAPFLRALKIRDSLDYTVDIIISKNHLAQFYLEKKQPQKALDYNLEAYILAKDVGNTDQELKSLHLLTQTDTKNPNDHLKKYVDLNDSLLLRERKQQQKFALIDFETQRIKEEKQLAEAKSEKLTVQRWFLLSGLGFLLIIGCSSIYILREKSKNRELQYSNEQKAAKQELYELMMAQNSNLEKGKHQERQRISRELHDGVLGRLSGIRLNMFSLKMKQDKETIAKALGHIDSMQEVEKEIRHISHNLASSELPKDNNFEKLLEDLIKNQFTSKERLEHSCIVDNSIAWKNIDYTIKLTIYRVAQEALHNIKKHAKAKHILLDVRQDGNCLIIKIIDDGVGFKSQALSSGIGIKNMKSRAASVKGKISISGIAPSGTKIILKIPI